MPPLTTEVQGVFQSDRLNLWIMPYSKAFREANPGVVEARQSIANAKFRKAHPEQLAAIKAAFLVLLRHFLHTKETLRGEKKILRAI